MLSIRWCLRHIYSHGMSYVDSLSSLRHNPDYDWQWTLAWYDFKRVDELNMPFHKHTMLGHRAHWVYYFSRETRFLGWHYFLIRQLYIHLQYHYISIRWTALVHNRRANFDRSIYIRPQTTIPVNKLVYGYVWTILRLIPKCVVQRVVPASNRIIVLKFIRCNGTVKDSHRATVVSHNQFNLFPNHGSIFMNNALEFFMLDAINF